MPTPLDLPEDIVRPLGKTTLNLRLARHSRIADIGIADGFALERITVVSKGVTRVFGADGVDIAASDAEKEAPRFQLSNLRVLSQDDLKLEVTNTSDDDRVFQGTLFLNDAPIPGEAQRPQRAAVTALTRPSPQPPTSRAAASSASPRRVPRTVNPGPNQLCVLFSRRQAEVALRLAQGARYVSPIERAELSGPIRRALGLVTDVEYDALMGGQEAEGETRADMVETRA